ncbi:uncharacterized protein LOC131209843 [Anopheles bellator]|uniref:uncharacterized protein LOC131209843 n=1 Tax=Anopheles bellator TaxID=139047 RepID=UPI0026477D51|nr:uncharacterized protein LOC131209843 [Anopheles bellator]
MPSEVMFLENGAEFSGVGFENSDDGDDLSTSTYCHKDRTINSSYSFMKQLTAITLAYQERGPKFFCDECDYYIHTRLSMITHMKMHHVPFCPVCFDTFQYDQEVSTHVTDCHPDIVQSDVVEEAEFPAGYTGATVAPPNSPNRYCEDVKQTTLDDSNSIPAQLVKKLREHQRRSNKSVQIRRISRDDSIKKPLSQSSSPSFGLRKMASKPKDARAAIRTRNMAQTDDGLVRVTSRFGRAISLKVPQF